MISDGYKGMLADIILWACVWIDRRRMRNLERM